MIAENNSPLAIAEELGSRLRRARLNADLSQVQVAEQAGVSRKIVMGAEKGRVQLESLIAIMVALGMESQFNFFLPEPELSPLQLAKLRGKQRQRASGERVPTGEEKLEW